MKGEGESSAISARYNSRRSQATGAQKTRRRPTMQNAVATVAAVLTATFVVVVATGGGGAGRREAASEPIVRTAQGQLRGSIMQSRLGRSIFSFRGVRFAEPPLGELRFEPPVPVRPWNGVRNATTDGSACPPPKQESALPTSEDCLFLNIYTTLIPDGGFDPRRSVMVFFHPGAYYGFTGHSSVFGPQYLLDHEVVLVTCNYRLGALGFLSTGDSVLPGNYGMKDQVAVLRWVRQNIAAFGGDPNSVTITGYSAGAASVMLHMVSPMSQDLFHRAIVMSASALTYSQQHVDPLPVATKLAQYFNCSTNSSESMRHCLQQQNAQDLASALGIYREFAWDPILVFSPVVETATSGERFLTDDPLPLFLAGNFSKVPVITGVTKDELGWKSLQVLANTSWTQEINNDYERVYPISFLYERDTERSIYITNELRRFYLNNRDLVNTTYNGLGLIYSDALVGYGVHVSSKVLPARSDKPVYYYKFTYPGRYSFVYLEGTSTPYGVVHHDDLIYLFHISLLFPLFKESDPESTMVERLTKLWVNFMETGNPTPITCDQFNNIQWEPITIRNTKYLEHGSTMEMKQGLNQDRMNLWDRLFPIAI